MFLPEDQHPAHGLLRSVVKDSNDPDTNVFVDSDGHANDNTPRFAGTQLVAPLDGGAWHMATLTARAGNNSKGCARARGCGASCSCLRSRRPACQSRFKVWARWTPPAAAAITLTSATHTQSTHTAATRRSRATPRRAS